LRKQSERKKRGDAAVEEMIAAYATKRGIEIRAVAGDTSFTQAQHMKRSTLH